MIACQYGNKEIFEVLVKADVNIHATTTLGDTALVIAQKNGFNELALKLIEKGATLRGKKSTIPKLEKKIS